MIQCICCYFNYTNNSIRKKNYIEFRKNFKHSLITVEISLDTNQFFINDSIKILATPENILWQKERAFNIALQNIPEKYNKIAWLDTDIVFLNDNWLTDLEKQLDHYAIVQPFERVFEKEGNNDCLNTLGYAKCVDEYIKENIAIPKYFAVGLSWGFNRFILKNGFFDKHILGSNDTLQILATIGDYFNTQTLGICTKSLLKSWIEYCEQIPPLSNYDMGYCNGMVEHLYHGNVYKRGYQTREQLLIDHQYDPKIHIDLDKNSLYKVTNIELKNKILSYFYTRHNFTNEYSK